MLSIKHLDDMLGRTQHDAARDRLVAEYNEMWSMHSLYGTDEEGVEHGIKRLYDGEDRIEVGAATCVYGSALLAIKSSLEHDKYFENFAPIVRRDADGNSYLYVLIGDGCDEYPRTRKHTTTEGSLSVRNELGASCSPERQFLYLSADAKEASKPVGDVLRAKELAVRRLRESLEPGQQIELDVNLCAKALADPRMNTLFAGSTPGVASNIIRVAVDYLPNFDLKHHALCYSSTGTSGIYGGLGSSVDKDNMFDPEVIIKSYEEVKHKSPEQRTRDGDIFWHDKLYWKECSDAMCAHLAEYKTTKPDASTTDLETEAHKFAQQQKHGFVKKRTVDGVETFEPFSFMDVVFKCVLHLDTNFGAVVFERIEAYVHQLSASREGALDYRKFPDKSPHAKWHNLLDTKTEHLCTLTQRLKNRLPWQSKDPQDLRLLGPHAVELFGLAGEIDEVMYVEDESEEEWLERNTIITMLLLHRGIAMLHSKFVIEKEEVGALVEMGRYLTRLVVNLHEPMSYNLWYMCIENPQNLQRNMDRFALDEKRVLGLQSLGCAQGPEALHHDSKIRIAMQTNQQPGCHRDHIRNSLLLRVAGPRKLSTRFDLHARHVHRIPDEPVDGLCRLCNKELGDHDAFPLPPGRTVTSIMSKYFFVRDPLCFACANGRVAVMLDVCAQAGGLVAGSQCYRIKEKSSIIAARKEKYTAFDEKRAERAKRDAEVMAKQMSELEGVPDLAEVHAEMTNAASHDTELAESLEEHDDADAADADAADADAASPSLSQVLANVL